MRERARERIGHLYPKHNGETVIAWLWARTVISPNPAVNAPVPLVSSFALSKKKGRECWAKPIVEGRTVRFEVTKGRPPRDNDGTMIRRQGARCVISDQPMSFDYLRAQGKERGFGAQLMAIVTQGKQGRNYHNASAEQVRIAESAVPAWRPVGEMQEGNQNVRGRMWGLTDFADLFTPRQLTALTTFSELVHEARDLATRDAISAGLPDDDVPLRDGGSGARAYGEALSVYLAFAVDKATDYYSSVARWHNSGEKISATFGRQAIAMVWDYAESNPFCTSSGNWNSHLMWIGKVLQFVSAAGPAVADINDAQAHSMSAQLISTDPPYYDNIGYADLSDFFYIWMRRSLRDIFPDIFSTLLAPKSAELIASAHRHESKTEAKQFFETGMRETFTNIRRFVREDLPQTVYYAFKQQDAGFMKGSKPVASTGWETMLTSLIESGFTITGTWPMRTEGRSRMNAQGTNALASSIVLVCRPRPQDAPAISRRRFQAYLRAELPAAINEMKTGSVAPVDMAQASIGPGMAIYSRCSRVLTAAGEPLTVRMALEQINMALDEALNEGIAELDAETRFAVDWFDEFGYREGDFGRADVLARGKNTSVDSVALAGVVESAGGRVKLIHWNEYDPCAYDPRQDKRPTVWEATHHLIEQLHHHGEKGASDLLRRLPEAARSAAIDLAYRLYNICERKNWAENALDYNMLVSSWSEITTLSAQDRQQEIGI